MASTKPAARRPAAAALMKQAFGDGAVKDKVAAMSRLQQLAISDRATFRQVVATLRDTAQPAALRKAALRTLETATFDPAAFAPYRSAYLTALRALRTDPDSGLREDALGILARERDGDTQAMLVQGLETPADALLPADQALQMLSYDMHSGAYDVARRIAARPSSPEVRREALRVLAADPKSAAMFEKILRDKEEGNPIRQLAACALQQLAPQRLHTCARDIAVSTGEDDQMKTLGMTVLAHFASDEAIAGDSKLKSHVDSLSKPRSGPASPMTLAAQKLAQRYA